MFAHAASADKFEGSHYLLQADWHWRSADVRSRCNALGTMIVVTCVNEQTLICMAGGSLSVRAVRSPRPTMSLPRFGPAVMLALKPIPSHLGDVGSNHDDRDHRT